MIKQKTIENMLLGVAAGDSFGLGVEFQNRDWIRQNVDFTRFVNKREGKYNIGYEPGVYSDDTEHTIGLIKAIIDERQFSQELLLEKWKEEYENDKARKGFPRQGHGSIKDWYEGRKTIQEVRGSQNNPDPGCAPPMRATPLGFLPSNRISEYAEINALASHENPKASAASTLVARASEYLLVKNGDPKLVIPYCKEFITHEETLEFLAKVDSLPTPESLNEKEFEILCGPQPIPTFKYREVTGLPNSAMRVAGAALHIIKYADSAFSGMRNAIYLGGDVDSIASISTGILAGRYGIDSIPSFIMDKLEGKDKLKSLASQFAEFVQ